MAEKQSIMVFGPVPGANPEFGVDDRVCFCFGHTRKDIEEDYHSNGQSLILAQIAAAKKAGGCECAVKNPKGR